MYAFTVRPLFYAARHRADSLNLAVKSAPKRKNEKRGNELLGNTLTEAAKAKNYAIRRKE